MRKPKTGASFQSFPEDASISSDGRSNKFRLSEHPSNYVQPLPYKSANVSSLSSKTRFNIPKPELKVSSQPRSFKPVSTKPPPHSSVSSITNDRLDLNKHLPKPTTSKSTSQIDMIRDLSNMYSSPAINNSNKPTRHFQSNFSTDHVDHMGQDINHLRYQSQMIEKVPRPLPRVPQQQHKVIEIVPKPPTRQMPSVDWNVPDQTLGIPVISPSASASHLHSTQPNRSAFSYSMHPPPMSPMHMNSHAPPMMFNNKQFPLIKSKSMFNVASNMPQIIHQHPLVSGNIPPTSHFNDSYTLKKNATSSNIAGMAKAHVRPPNMNAPSILSSPSTQSTGFLTSNASPKKENGEKNKVKFSDTVTVAVVPVCKFYSLY